MGKQLFFIALLPPADTQKEVTEIKQYFADVYNSKAALKSPPHITLQPPFNWEVARLPELTAVANLFAHDRSSFSVSLDGFAAFKPRVIYVDVVRTEPLLEIQKALMNELESTLNIVHRPSKTRPFAPHMTVGFKDLNKENFYKAWEDFKGREFQANFIASELTLLQFHQTERKWLIEATFSLKQ